MKQYAAHDYDHSYFATTFNSFQFELKLPFPFHSFQEDRNLFTVKRKRMIVHAFWELSGDKKIGLYSFK